MHPYRSLACLGATLFALATACESTVVVQPCADGECGGEGAGASGADGEGAGGNTCGLGKTKCGKACVDTSTDPDHCGGCFEPCDGGDACINGTCSGACPPNLVDCGDFCADIFNDPQNCGGCFSPCGDEQFCSQGMCSGETCPGGVCGICDVQFLAPEPSLTLFGTTFGAADNFTPGCVGVQSPEVSYLFTAPQSGTYVIDTVGSSFDTVLSLLGPNGCFESACDDDTIGLASQLTVFLNAGDQIQIVVDGFSPGDFQLNINLDDPCDGPCGSCASVITLPGSVPQTTPGSTSGANDDLVPSCTGQPGSEVIHSFTAPTTGSFIFSTANSGFDTVLTLLDSVSCTELGCNDDFGGQQTSRVTATLNQGQTVYVVVDGKNASGNYSLFINGTPVAVCPTADLGSVVPVTISGSTTGGASIFTPSCSFGQAPDHSYTFTAPTTKVYEMNTVGSNYDTVLHVLGATCSGVSLACNDDSFGLQSQVFVNLTAGQTVTVVVDGFGSSFGNYVLTIE